MEEVNFQNIYHHFPGCPNLHRRVPLDSDISLHSKLCLFDTNICLLNDQLIQYNAAVKRDSYTKRVPLVGKVYLIIALQPKGHWRATTLAKSYKDYNKLHEDMNYQNS